ncbi:MAG: carboxyl transferase domain-containing protein [Acidimicrobiia bacterium]|nr:carboxyl transferase domain-containing protein [Acidimicrobiia bacterium]
MPRLTTRLDIAGDDFVQNRADMLELISKSEGILERAAAGGGEAAMERLRARGKFPIRERVSLLLDRDTPFLEIGPQVGHMTNYNEGGGAIVGIGVVAGTEVVLVGNDPSVMGGALTALSGKKILRALEIARQNRLPYIQFVESAGGDLRGGGGADRTLEEIMRANLGHFSDSGRMFYEITELSSLGVPTISVVFGSSTAGGAYQPGLSDYTILVRNRAKVFLGGPPLVKMATGEDSDDETLGGAEMHATVSGLADYLAEDEYEGIRMCRDVVAHLHWSKLGRAPLPDPLPPKCDPEELLGLVDRDLRGLIDIREVIARIVDGSDFEEFKPRYGPTLICGWANIHGFPVGVLGNNGPLFSESSQKATQFIQLCNQTGTPLLFLQNITGYMVGKDFERQGIVKHGSQMINALSNSKVPHITVIVGGSYGAGNYGMGGRSFATRFVFLWPTAKIAVMGPKQIAGVMSIVRRGQAARKGIEFDEEADAQQVAAQEHAHEEASLAFYATGRGDDDGVIDPRDTRDVVGFALSACHSNEVEGAAGYGVFRM